MAAPMICICSRFALLQVVSTTLFATLFGALAQPSAPTGEAPSGKLLLRNWEARNSSARADKDRVVAVKLQRMTAPLGAGADTAASPPSFFVGKVYLGSSNKQEFSVLFDTSSGQLLLPSYDCTSNACLEHKMYNTSNSLALNADGRTWAMGEPREFLEVDFAHMDLGDGRATGDLMSDMVCFGEDQGACARIGLLAATELDDEPFRYTPHDGLVGLGMGRLSTSPIFNVLSNLPGLPPQFAISIRGDSGEVILGGLPSAASSAALWTPVHHPEEGFWQVSIKQVRVGDRVIGKCAGGCSGIIDTTAQRTGVPTALAEDLLATLHAAQPTAAEGGRCEGPVLHLELTSGGVLSFKAEDYAGRGCKDALIKPLALEPAETYNGTLVLGEMLLNRYDVAFDGVNMQIGFTNVAPHTVRLGELQGEQLIEI